VCVAQGYYSGTRHYRTTAMAFQSYDDAGFGATLNLEEIAADGRYLFYIFFDIIIITACPAK